MPGSATTYVSPTVCGDDSTKASAEMKLSMPRSERRLTKSFIGSGQGERGRAQQQGKITLHAGTVEQHWPQDRERHAGGAHGRFGGEL